MHILQLWY